MAIKPTRLKVNRGRLAYRRNGLWKPDRASELPLTDDGTDQTAAWLSYLDTISDGTALAPTVVSLPGGNFRADGGFRTVGRSHLRLIAPPAGTPFVGYSELTSVEADVDTQMGFDLTRCTDVGVSNVRWVGPNDQRTATGYALYQEAMAFDHAFALRSGCVACFFTDCTYADVYGDGLYVGFQNEGVANVGCWATGIVGAYAGRNNVSVTHADGFTLTDSEFDWAGFAGVNIEPNSANDKAWDVTFDGVRSGSRFNPFVCTGANNGPLPQRKNLSYIGCEVIRCASSHAGLSITRPPIPFSNAGELLVDGFVDHRNPTIYGLNLTAIWRKVTIRNCDIWTSAPDATAVRANCAVFDAEDGWQPGDLTIENNDFSGGTRGFAHLLQDLSSPPADLVDADNALAA